MPVTSALFLTAAIAICGIPPLNGFVSEWLIYAGAFHGASLPWVGTAMLSIIGLVSLALIGGLALACFVKAHGVIFLGAPRSESGTTAGEVGPLLIAPMVTLAALCAAIGLYPAMVLRLIAPAVRALDGAPPPAGVFDMLGALSRVSLVVVSVILALALLRKALLRQRPVSRAATWGCGYPIPTARMQYSAGSFAAPVLETFRRVVATAESGEITGDPFPVRGSLAIDYRDLAADRAVFPIARILQRLASRLRVLQQGRIQLYLMYLFGALIVVLFWQLISGR
jgi:NADH:ubiquinone oxidoreductase subunit 5 (subunit L)/multisubunit Na+/H+ antiporter MnhA subunit